MWFYGEQLPNGGALNSARFFLGHPAYFVVNSCVKLNVKIRMHCWNINKSCRRVLFHTHPVTLEHYNYTNRTKRYIQFGLPASSDSISVARTCSRTLNQLCASTSDNHNDNQHIARIWWTKKTLKHFKYNRSTYFRHDSVYFLPQGVATSFAAGCTDSTDRHGVILTFATLNGVSSGEGISPTARKLWGPLV